MTARWAAPGRVNLIGEHVDYQDGLVLPFALPQHTTATVERQSGDQVRVRSRGEQEEFQVASTPGQVQGWAAYVAGVVWSLREEGADVPGLSIDVDSDVPVGAGLSSSAAIECAVAAAIGDELALQLSAASLATIARRAENSYVGVPTGSMDQMASMLCERGHALLLDCRDLSTRQVPFDLDAASLTLLVINTRAEHSLVGSEYADRRHDCEAAADELGLSSLRDAEQADLPRISDPVHRRRAQHVVSEIARVREVASILDAGRPADIGAQLSASHQSLRDDFEVSCDELDEAVDAALVAGALGARMTGGGFGGCAIALARDDEATDVRRRVDAAFDRRGWQPADIFEVSPNRGAHRLD
ncbi:MAG: galactokinase [Nocardioidaceae bacterium]|nr:galactokinase [Nocardioidaceae bacterium]